MYTSTILAITLAALPTSYAATWDVSVGANGLFVYNPPSVKASPGDIVNFTFIPVAPNVTDNFPTRQFQVPEGTAPLWFYCKQVNHCGMGMVFAINAPDDPSPKSFQAFQKLAIMRNGTAASSSSAAASSTAITFTTPPPPVWHSATATVTQGSSTWTTTYTSYEGSPPPTPAPVPMEHTILVGENGGLTYDPPSISASIGDTVIFEFRAKNHTATQSNFLNPCQDLQSSTGTIGFNSGFLSVSNGTVSNFPQFRVKINDTAPIWGYCGQTGHCTAGMVFAINAVESGPNNFAAFQALAKQTQSNA
ncbi:hypothetical protein BDQ12DRAFT_586018, partial [Crucibulum laeve]